VKDSGIGWIGRIPDHWGVTKIRYVARLESGHTPSRQHPEWWIPEECTIPWVSLADVGRLRSGDEEFIHETSESISEIGMANSAARLLPARTVVLSRTASVGFSAMITRPMATTQDFVNWICGPDMLPEYLLYVFRAMTQEFERLRFGSVHNTIYMPDVRSFSAPLPSRGTQEAIVAFLRERLPKLNDLVAKKQRLIELLQEKRQALITQAVTRGLDPNVPMKDSGVEWLGEIPAHWEVKRVKHISPQVSVGIVITPSKYYIDGEDGVPCLRSLNVRSGSLRRDNLVYISCESHELLSKSALRQGDLVAVRTGQPGTTAVVDEFFDGANCIDLIIIRRSEMYSSEFLSYVLGSEAARAQFQLGAEGAIQLHFNIETAKNLLFGCPRADEQRVIACYLDEVLRGLDSLVGKVEIHIEKLKEYRQALITSAVTGKIDVTKAEEAVA
jgi:type I restriction enzyme S subunit